MTGVHIRGLEKSFGSTPVLKGIDLEIAPGEVVGLIGPNGAGKTTLMSCLLAFLRPDAGTITIDGLPPDDLAIRRRTGFVPERMNFDRRATSLMFLQYMARLGGTPLASVPKMLERMDVGHGARKRLSEHSRGMLQRVGMAQALLGNPAYLFLDEPASGLDPNGVFLVREVILEQKKRGVAVLLNSHQLSEVERVCDRVLFLSGGVISTEERLRDQPKIAMAITLINGSFDPARIAAMVNGTVSGNVVTFEVTGEAQIADAVRRLAETGAGVIDVRRQTADLERMFRGER